MTDPPLDIDQLLVEELTRVISESPYSGSAIANGRLARAYAEFMQDDKRLWNVATDRLTELGRDAILYIAQLYFDANAQAASLGFVETMIREGKVLGPVLTAGKANRGRMSDLVQDLVARGVLVRTIAEASGYTEGRVYQIRADK